MQTSAQIARSFRPGTNSKLYQNSELARHHDHVWDSNEDPTAAVIWDFSTALRRWHLWVRLGWQDVMLRYRRSLIGPFWLTLSMGIMVGTLGLIYGELFNIEAKSYLPYLTVGLLVWGLISSCISDGCQTFIESHWLILQINVPLSMFPLRVIWRNIIIFLHNIVIYLFIVLIFGVKFSWITFAAIPGLLLIFVNAFWCAILLGMLSARFRDLPQIVASMLQIAFFATPIFWHANLITTKIVVVANPFYHFIELVRSPLLGQAPAMTSWVIAGTVTVVGAGGTFLFFRRFRHRISVWV
jgi:ABC-type polysaccharide/polyol phosphate export permease